MVAASLSLAEYRALVFAQSRRTKVFSRDNHKPVSKLLNWYLNVFFLFNVFYQIRWTVYFQPDNERFCICGLPTILNVSSVPLNSINVYHNLSHAYFPVHTIGIPKKWSSVIQCFVCTVPSVNVLFIDLERSLRYWPKPLWCFRFYFVFSTKFSPACYKSASASCASFLGCLVPRLLSFISPNTFWWGRSWSFWFVCISFQHPLRWKKCNINFQCVCKPATCTLNQDL